MNTNSIKSEILEQSESEVLPVCSNQNFQMFICNSYRPTVESSGSDVNNICSYRPTVESSGSDVNNICSYRPKVESSGSDVNNICSYRPTVESSGSDVNNICIENQNLGSVAHENNSGLIYSIKQEPVDDYSLTNVYNESKDCIQNSVVNNDSQTSSFSPIIYGNVDSNNHNRTNMEEVTSSSILNETHVNKEKQSTRHTPTIVLRRAKRTQKNPSSGCMGCNSSHNMEDNSSHNTGGNSTIYLFSDQAKIPQLPPKDTGTGILSENQSLEPQVDNTDWKNNCLNFLKDALQNTVSI